MGGGGEWKQGSGIGDVCVGVPSREVVLKATRLLESQIPLGRCRQYACQARCPGERRVKRLWRGGALSGAPEEQGGERRTRRVLDPKGTASCVTGC